MSNYRLELASGACGSFSQRLSSSAHQYSGFWSFNKVSKLAGRKETTRPSQEKLKVWTTNFQAFVVAETRRTLAVSVSSSCSPPWAAWDEAPSSGFDLREPPRCCYYTPPGSRGSGRKGSTEHCLHSCRFCLCLDL